MDETSSTGSNGKNRKKHLENVLLERSVVVFDSVDLTEYGFFTN